jgi:chromosome segregation ATPase
MRWFESLRRRLFGPSAVDILQQMSAKLDSFTEAAVKITNNNHRVAVGVEQAETRLAELIEQLKSEPFMALKKWMDQATEMQADFSEQRRTFQDRERQLLHRWKAQVDGLQETIEELRNQLVVVTPPIANSGKRFTEREISPGVIELQFESPIVDGILA